MFHGRAAALKSDRHQWLELQFGERTIAKTKEISRAMEGDNPSQHVH